ncbi:MMP21 [Mytilus coruscus]|uniref:MMP21 n=1 Tax=Mytilus coruscus TaxID=42192 RepID=A0A6J8BVI6_MYTCO|nr:MMP21 [Mytilus coruscus]
MAKWSVLFHQTIVVVQIIWIVRPVTSEKFFQYRDHRDQNYYLKQANENKNEVQDAVQAEMQLEKYGYLRCKVGRRRRRSVDTPTHNSFNVFEGNGRSCSEDEIKTAIKEYQKKYKLPETGVVDEETRKFMSTSRCGNSDSADNPDIEPVDITNLVPIEVINPSPSKKRWKRTAKNTVLYKLLFPQLTDSSVKISGKRRTKFLLNHIQKIKNEDPLWLRPKRHKRFVNIHINETGLNGEKIRDGQKFTKTDIRWRLLETGFSTRIPLEDQRASLNMAFRMWSEVIPLNFEEDVSGDIKAVDIEIAFGRGSHQNCERKFDGNGGEIAHSRENGRDVVHFDDEEDYKSIESITKEKNGIYLLRVAVHEIGHVLGLSHSSQITSIMYAIYHQSNVNPDKEFELTWDDRKAVQKAYGVCRGKFNTIFDWVRKTPSNGLIYNTYFFRSNQYWMYENHANRTRYGDPLYVAQEWKGVPDNVDGYLHVWYFAGTRIIDDTYFLKGENYFLYNSEEDKVYDGGTGKISEKFGPKKGQDLGVPDNLDTAYFDKRDKNIYFFKGDTVYVYDPTDEEDETKGCCLRIRKIWEEFPPLDGERQIEGDLDAVYYSYNDTTVYFFKGEDVWKNELFHPRQKQIKNGVKYVGNWFAHWYDICDVRPTFSNFEIPSNSHV